MDKLQYMWLVEIGIDFQMAALAQLYCSVLKGNCEIVYRNFMNFLQKANSIHDLQYVYNYHRDSIISHSGNKSLKFCFGNLYENYFRNVCL